MIDFEDNAIVKPIILNNKNNLIVFSMRGNYVDENNNYIPTETLYNTWKDYIGKEVTSINKFHIYILCDVNRKDNLIFLEMIHKK